MSVSDKIKSLLQLKGVKNKDLADYLGITPQSMRNKFTRGSFSAEDLIRISAFLGCKLYFDMDGDIKIPLSTDDLRPPALTDQTEPQE
ncbi:helix-turn-helix domain-containing protein [Acetobacterium wieringae]|uniref:helix-turn-helix domain-containing protein n=1 Tax=Acetobacterium wieringae TaxID=52694 RepID=UPI0026EF11A7|nr:helix-turn-helix domain-containing protein [Acetobacterium wieringae]